MVTPRRQALVPRRRGMVAHPLFRGSGWSRLSSFTGTQQSAMPLPTVDDKWWGLISGVLALVSRP